MGADQTIHERRDVVEQYVEKLLDELVDCVYHENFSENVNQFWTLRRNIITQRLIGYVGGVATAAMLCGDVPLRRDDEA